MKIKLKSLLAVGIGLGTLGGFTAALTNSSTSKLEPAKAIAIPNNATKYIPMSAEAFSDWTNDAGSFAAKDATYWPTYAGYSGEDGNSFNYPFQALDTFFRGESNEGWKGTLTLNSWTQYSQYVYFTWGGARDYGYAAGEDVKLIIHYGSHVYEMLNNTFMDNQMLLRYFRIPDADFDDTQGVSMYIELSDNRGSGFGFHNFGYLHPNATEEEVGDAMRFYLNNLSTDSRNSQRRMKNEIVKNYFTHNADDKTSLRAVFFKETASINDGFESQSDFLKHWYFDYSYFNYSNAAIHPDKAISTGKVRPGDSGMPFNVSDDAFFRGWYETSLDSGFVDGDGSIYRFISRPVKLTGDCIVSIKMGGTASFHVIDATVNPDTNQAADLAWIDNRIYSTAGDEVLTNGFNTCTMVRHVINLKAYQNRTVQFAIADISSGGWGAAYFDDLQVNVDLTSVGFQVETVTQTYVNHEQRAGTYYPVYFDQYINSQQIEGNDQSENYNPNGVKYRDAGNAVADTSDAKAAHEYVEDFYTLVRANNGQNNTCDQNFRYGNEMKAKINAYNSLANTNIKKIVCASDDYQRASGDWAKSAVTILSLGASIRGIAFDNGIAVDTYTSSSRHALGFANDSTATIILVVSFASAIVLCAFALVLAKKKKRATK